jgi:Zn-dependent protease with chaperone function
MKLHGGEGGGLSRIFSTHPTLDKRIQELDKIQKQLGQVAPREL